MKRGFDDFGSDEVWTPDACVIGAGAGGAAVATALSEAGMQTLVVEEGRHYRPQDFKADAGWAYRNLYAGRGGRSAVGNCLIPVPGGRGVGGSTLINSAICFRPPESVLQEWVDAYGCVNHSPADMLPLLDRVWDVLQVTVNPVHFQRENNLIFKAGADALGLPGQWMSRSAPGCVGCGVCQFGCPSGGKTSVDRSFLPIAYATGRCSVHGDCRVTEIEVEGDRVVAVRGELIDPQTLLPSGRFKVRADVFVLSSGAVATPNLLRDQGLVGGEVCGQHLHLHPALGLMGRFEQEIRPWSGVTQGYYVDRWERGYLLQVYSASPDQLYVGMPWSLGDDLLAAISELRHMGLAGPLVHDVDSVGSVDGGLLRYTLGDGDRGRLLAGMRECAQVFFAAGAQQVYSGVVGSRPINRVEDIDAALPDDTPASHLYLYASHPMGTCRMGDDPARSVVGPDGRVWGWQNLYDADASVVPPSLGVNPPVTVMATGLMVGARIASR